MKVILTANIKILGKFGQGLLKGILGFAGAIGGALITGLSALMGAITALGDSFFELYNTGINMASGISDGASGLGRENSTQTEHPKSLLIHIYGMV